jgi:hypothetical protein
VANFLCIDTRDSKSTGSSSIVTGIKIAKKNLASLEILSIEKISLLVGSSSFLLRISSFLFFRIRMQCYFHVISFLRPPLCGKGIYHQSGSSPNSAAILEEVIDAILASRVIRSVNHISTVIEEVVMTFRQRLVCPNPVKNGEEIIGWGPIEGA